MAIEIMEFTIKATVDAHVESKKGIFGGRKKREIEHEEVVRECVEQVMQVLKHKKNR